MTKNNPFKAITADLKTLARLAVQGSIHAPEFHQELIKKNVVKVLKKYVSTRKQINRIIKTVTQ